MKRIISAATILALTTGSVAHAAQDMGLTLHNDGRGTSGAGGVGAQAGVKIRFGARDSLRAAEKVTLSLAAGPVLRTSGPRAGAAVAGVASLSVRPGYVTTLTVAGQPVIRDFTRLGAAEADRQDERENKPKKKQSSGDKVAWVAAVAGGVMVALIGAAAIALTSGCYECDD